MSTLNLKTGVDGMVQAGNAKHSSLPVPALPCSQNQGAGLLHEFVGMVCGLTEGSLRSITKEQLPPPARQLLDHTNGMTLTLEAFHQQTLQVEILREMNGGNDYGREIFLRTTSNQRVVEYGIISICMEAFTSGQQGVIRAGGLPFGTQLDRFHIPFVSAPFRFFTVSVETVAHTPLGKLGLNGPLYGRFNQLVKLTGEPLAWLMEILPTPFINRR